jgi:tRNA-N(6)-(isopentenyl)adenosine-37 thiotransferase enzyme MiaB
VSLDSLNVNKNTKNKNSGNKNSDVEVEAVIEKDNLQFFTSNSIDNDMEIMPETEPERQEYFIEKMREYISTMEFHLGRKLTACIKTFGCQMNARDSEKLLGILLKIGYVETEDENADFVLYNTCTVRENANQKVYGHLGLLNKFKRKNPNMLIVLCGCMMQEQVVVDKIKKSYKFVDIIFGTHNIYKLAELIYERTIEERKMVVDIWEKAENIVEDMPSSRKYRFKSGVNIMYGCDNFCTFCIVPSVRGRERSRELDDIVEEVKNLVADGVIEIMLLGQNVNSYGRKLKNPKTFAQLLRELEKIEGLERIRFMTPHPKDFSDDVIEVLANSDKVCKHVHFPLQSGSSSILKRMNRRYNKEQFIECALKIKERVPEVSLTTDIIVGFPGETDEDFEDTLDVVRKVRFDSAFTFIYSKRTGTPAASWEGVPDEVIKERFPRLLKEIQVISAEICGRHKGIVQPVLVEGVNDQNKELLNGRLSNNVLVHFPGDISLIGSIVNVKLDEAKGFYYLGTKM